MAEREGFEPSVPLPVRQFSKLFLSATQASLRINKKASFEDCKYSNSVRLAKNNFTKVAFILKCIDIPSYLHDNQRSVDIKLNPTPMTSS